jgi:hypothetical protein
MTSQFAKDPQEVLDYPWKIPLDAGDSVSSFTAAKISGDVVLDSYAEADGTGTIWLSGGTDGTASVFTLTAVTSGGRTFETTVIVNVVDSSSALVAEFLMRYPAFASVGVSQIAYWLKDAETTVTDSWIEADISPARMALAAHNLALSGAGSAGGAVGALAAMGVTSFKSASMSVNFAEGAVIRSGSGGYSSTKYGVQFLTYLRRNVGGPRLVGCA